MLHSLLRSALAVAGSVAVAVVCFVPFHTNSTIAATFLLLEVSLAGAYASRTAAVVAAVTATLCLDYLFIPPIGSITIGDPQGWIVLAIFLAVSLVVTNLAAQLRQQRDELASRQSDAEKLHALNRAILLSDGGANELHRLLVNKSIELFGFEEAALFENASGKVHSSRNGAISEADLRKAAHRSSVETKNGFTSLPVALGNKIYGGFAFIGAPLSASLLQSLGNTIAVGLAQARTQEAANHAEAVRKSEELKSLMIDALAHELKTPLTAIEVAADMLHTGRISLEQREDLVDVVQQESQRLRRLVTEAIHLARIEAKRLRLECQAIPVETIVRAALESLGARANSHTVDLKFPESGARVWADFELVTQLIKQLLDNAVKYSSTGKRITVSAAEENGLVSIAVRDEGPGLTEMEQGRIFEKFYRARRDSAAVPGTGMGLAIAREIAEAHGGAIHVESQLGRGSCFTVTLPAASRPSLAESAQR